MPEQSLLDALDALRERYMQRLKTANTLFTALKATSGALNKTNKALLEYAELNTAADLSKIQDALLKLETAHMKEELSDPLLPDLRREIKLLSEFVAALRDALAALRVENIDVVRLSRACSTLQKTKVQEPALEELLPPILAELTEAEHSLGATFGETLREALVAQGIEVGGRPPIFEIGRFEISADFASRMATLSYGKEVVLRHVPLSVDRLIKAYERELKSIAGRDENGEQWVRQLYEAWEAARRKRGTAEVRANIVECYYELVLIRQGKTFRSAPSKRVFADYSRAQFAYDLDLFANRQQLAYKGQRAFVHVAIMANTDNPERCLWVVDGSGPHDGRYMGDIVFQSEE
jgi:hypothetical protein